MGLTTFSVYLWDIEDIVNHAEEVWHIFLEEELRAWRLGYVLGQK
jgi:hypothetical protein